MLPVRPSGKIPHTHDAVIGPHFHPRDAQSGSTRARDLVVDDIRDSLGRLLGGDRQDVQLPQAGTLAPGHLADGLLGRDLPGLARRRA